ncbi:MULTISPECIES: PAS domain-containing hybrid sensor histidine kinase/response regulator [unclassified Clostridium]|uniref:sensor histidine kinase n=1 Tax=unclassified Clostridium TaxID=2614128 RepID=UPI0002980830|nr:MULTISPECIES: PAS domain-containing hybrid sensor histidine kinase/response regulator [unclassified Clostridium]EKQ57356.1 MAG: PAS domain S-box [Clostridium sp. Maddingley MBC34-26]
MDLGNDFFLNEAQKVGKLGIFIYDIKKDIWNSSEVLNELAEIDDSCVKDFKGWLNTVHPSQRAEMESYAKEIIKTGKDFDKEFRAACQNDEIEKWVVGKGKVFFDEFGNPDKIAGIVHDVSEIKKSEERYKKLYMEFQQKEALLVSLINSIPDLIFYKDINGAYLGCNKAFEDFAGIKEKDIIGNTDADIFEKEDAEFFGSTDLKTMQQREHIRYENWVKYPDGKYVFLDTLKTPYYDSEGNILGLIGVSRDITERKKKEELQKRIEEERRRLNELKEADRIKTEFFANMSHELRTPINVIFSAVQMEEIMLKDYLSENISIDKFKYINMMKQNCYRILRLIDNLIDITKIDNNYFEISKSNHDIINLVENITLSVVDYIQNKGISITFDTDVEERIIACDPEKIERIILNLLSNAVKFTPSGGNIIVKIENNTNDICIRVKDTGKGIPKNKLDSIFERFVQVDKSLTRTHEGSGIGLSIVKKLIELHGGKISVISKEGQGTEFIMYIPCKLVESEACDKSVCNTQIGKSFIEKINIEFSDIYN